MASNQALRSSILWVCIYSHVPVMSRFAATQSPASLVTCSACTKEFTTPRYEKVFLPCRFGAVNNSLSLQGHRSHAGTGGGGAGHLHSGRPQPRLPGDLAGAPHEHPIVATAQLQLQRMKQFSYVLRIKRDQNRR
jgi:hypothetical protein